MKPKQRQDIARVLLAAANSLDEDYYLREACGYFALALHELFDYKLAVVKDDDTVAHVFAVDEHSNAFDVLGKTSIKEIKDRYWDIPDRYVDYITPSELKENLMGDDEHPLMPYSKEEVENAKYIVLSTQNKYKTNEAKASVKKLSTMYHVGRLDQPRRKPAVSYEGSGLSVSLHPDEWRKIARGQVGGDTWELTKEDPKFLMATAANKKKAVNWAAANGWIAPQKRYRVSWFDDEMDDTMSTEFDSLEEAQEEADAYGVEPEEVDSFVLDNKGKAYWKSAFSSKPSNSLAKDFAIIWFAEANGYDGVWWNDKLDPDRLSAPRGVIFQSKLPEWSKRKLSHD
jgi:hypothetical protein